jgi:ribonuclease BN (tRNA processing enzyme)
LAHDADLLIAEMMDVDTTLARVRLVNPRIPEAEARNMETHLRTHHLTARDVGEMARRANVQSVVITHFSGAERNDPQHFQFLKTINEVFKGPAAIGNDMDAY